MDLKEIGINARNWDDLAQDRDYWRALVNAALDLRVHGVEQGGRSAWSGLALNELSCKSALRREYLHGRVLAGISLRGSELQIPRVDSNTGDVTEARFTRA